MSSKCDFYAGRGLDAQYLGSIGHDALAAQLCEDFEGVTTREAFDASLAEVFRRYGEIPANKGWPWPWDDSHMTGLAIAFDEGDVWVSHPSKRWARLANHDVPGLVVCRYPDLGGQARSTPEGRLRWQLRHRGLWAASLEHDIVLALLGHVATRLAVRFVHVFEQEGHYRVLRSFWDGRDKISVELALLVEALRASEEFPVLLAERKAAHNEPEWDLLSWFVDTGAAFEADDLDIVLTGTQPVYFGYPLGPKALDSMGHPLAYRQLRNTSRLAEGLTLLDVVLDRISPHYASMLATEILDFGCLPVPVAGAYDWLSSSQPALGGLSLLASCATVEGRHRARQFAAQLVSGEL